MAMSDPLAARIFDWSRFELRPDIFLLDVFGVVETILDTKCKILRRYVEDSRICTRFLRMQPDSIQRIMLCSIGEC